MKRLVLLVAILLAFAVPAQAAEIAPFTGTGTRKVVVFGDSLSVQTQQTFSSLTGGSYQTSYNATSGYAMYNWLPFLPSAVSAVPNAVVLALGTNDAKVQGDQSVWWQQAMTDLGPVCKVWIKMYAPDLKRIQFSQKIQPIITNAGGKIYDWNSQALLHRNWFQADNTHLTAAGISAYANALNAAQALC